MKPLFYKSLLLFLAFTGGVLGQKHTVLNKSFDIGSAKIIELDLKNIPLTILPSKDNKIHIDFKMDFKGFSEQEIKAKKAKVKFNKSMHSNSISLSIKSETTISPSHFFSTKAIVIDDAKNFVSLSENKEEKKDKRKSKADIINEIITTPLEDESFLSQITKQIENDKDAKVQKAHFLIRVPEKLQLKIKAQGVRLTSKIGESKNLKLKMNGSSFKARKLSDATILIKNASLKVEEIESGSYNLKDVSNCLLGSIKTVIFESETSKIEIGEIHQNVKIKDFNSELFLYNFSNDFKKFDLKSEYTKVHFFHPKNDFSQMVIGNNTVHHFGNLKINMQPNKNGKKVRMMSRDKKGKGKYAGHIDFDIIHGIIYSYEDKFTPNKNK